VYVEPQPRRFDGPEAGFTELSAPAQFSGWPVSPATAKAVADIQVLSEQCGGSTLFQFPWAPILYTILNRENSTTFDLPFYDTISLSDAKVILGQISARKPDMIVIEERYLAYDGPFPALGMKHVGEVLQAQTLLDYDHLGTAADGFKTFEIYCRSVPD